VSLAGREPCRTKTFERESSAAMTSKDGERGLAAERVAIDEESIHAIAMYANGDARRR